MRPLVAESYDSAGNPVTRAVDEIRDPSPARTLGFDLLILIAGCGWLAVHASDRSRRYRWTGLEVGGVFVAVAGVISCVFAGNRRLAINATVDWLCLPVLAIVLVQLLRERTRRGLLIAAVSASACVQAAQCYEQYFVGFAETRAEYEKHKAEFWAKQGVDLDSSKVETYERRLNANEAFGYLPHSNLTASYLALCGFAGAGVAVARVRQRPRSDIEWLVAAGTVLLVGAIFGALVLTKSAGAMIAAGAGAVLWIGLRRLAPWIEAHRRRAVLMGWACVAAVAVTVVGHGVYHESLPGWSLTFRWQYWTTSAEMIADHPWTGVGRENFGRHYLQFKSIESPEEVSNPHNPLVQAAADWGVIGLIGVVVMLIGGSWAAARPASRKTREGDGDELRKVAKAVAWAIGLLAIITLLRLPLLGTSDPNFLFYSTMTVGLCWIIGFAVFGWSNSTVTSDLRSTGGQAASGTRVARGESRGSELNTAIGVGLFALLLHETINFALFVPATATTFFALLAVWLSGRELHESPKDLLAYRSRMCWLILAGAIAATAIVGWGIVLPVSRAAGFMEIAKDASARPQTGPIEQHPTFRAFVTAAQADPLDPTPWIEKARWLARAGGESSVRGAIESLRQGIVRDPFNASYQRAEAQLYLSLAETTHERGDYASAIEAEKAALALYPGDPSGLVSLGDTLLAAGEALESDELLREA
ncbi:MAG: O-antigen ligase family protein, partial [Phycisphaerales bacterium]|nr:O-antigen ligase family protein [Phycisphaerales bacterium]